ncbi:hypothetical protein ACOMHN_009473 [Nucella lapillus]
MSLFTDPEIPFPMPTVTRSGSTTSGSDEEGEVTESVAPEFSRAKPRLLPMLSVPACSRSRGFMVLAALALVSMITVLYARERVQSFVTQGFSSQTSYVTMPSAWQMPPPPESFQAQVLPQNNHATTPIPQMDYGEEDYDDAKPIVDSREHFPEEEQGLPDEDVSLLEEFLPMPDMTLHYLWCGYRFFDFRNYVAVTSAIEALKPKKIVFHYQHPPMKDLDEYFTWFERLSSLYNNFVAVKVNATDLPCYSGGFKRFALVFDILRRYGGIYIPEDAIFLRFADRFRHMNFVSGVSSCNLQFFFEGIVIGRYGQFEIPETQHERVRKLSVCHEQHVDENSLHPCTPGERYLETTSHVPSCVRLESALFPKNVWDAHDKISTLVKLIAYGKTDLHPRFNQLAMYSTPRLAHYLCTEDCALSFTVYLSILSAIHVAGMEKVLIHGPRSPSGRWWNRLQSYHKRVVFYMENNVTRHVAEDMKRYIMRTEILLHYGGVFHDSHVLWTQPLPDELLGYEAVVSPDWHSHGNWPESINHALLIARGGATYLQQLLLDLLQMYWDNVRSDIPWLADHFLSYRLLELDPTLVCLYRPLQVKCLNHNCHPTWKPGYRSHFLLNRPGEAFDWRTETLSVHWLDSFQELEVDQIKFTSGIIVDIARHVLAVAGVDVNHL